ncbi:RNA polymerase sigma factor YlaC [bacterium HR36]|nr:RNA polymerase sigma factor YlaC [bacterium HR36]
MATEAVHASNDPAEWVDRYGDMLFRVALVHVGDREIAEELVQETFLAALRNRQQFAGRSSERTWLVAILKHKIADHFRQQRSAPKQFVQAEPSEAEDPWFTAEGKWRRAPAAWHYDPVELAHAHEFQEQLRQCLEKLPARQATAFVLREVEELSSCEVCEILGTTPGSLGQLLYRARMGLRQCLEHHWFGTTKGE